MKKIILAFFLLQLCGAAYSYENSLFNLETPSTLDASELEFQLKHRMAVGVDNGFLGGSQVGLGLRWSILSGLDTSFQYYRPNTELNLNLGYTYYWEAISLYTKIMGQYYTFENLLSERIHSAYFSLSLQTDAFWERVIPALNFSYDLHTQTLGLGLGLKVYILKRLAVLAEYYPYLGDNPFLKSSMAFGFELEPNGHHFKFLVGNDYDLGSRRWEGGTISSQWHFGFNIERRFVL